MTTEAYHYTESGLDTVYLTSGFAFVNGPGGRCVKIKDIDRLHEAIGRHLTTRKRNLTGKEIRFRGRRCSSRKGRLQSCWK